MSEDIEAKKQRYCDNCFHILAWRERRAGRAPKVRVDIGNLAMSLMCYNPDWEQWIDEWDARRV